MKAMKNPVASYRELQVKVMQEPNASINTVEKRTGKKVAAAGITALFIGIMLAFFIEYIKKMQRAAR